MEYVVKVHYKTDPKDLTWTYSGKHHVDLREAEKEAHEAMGKPHIDNAIIIEFSPDDPERAISKAIEECIESIDKLIHATNIIDEMPVDVSIVAVFCTVLDDYISQKRLTVEEAVRVLDAGIKAIRECGGKIL